MNEKQIRTDLEEIINPEVPYGRYARFDKYGGITESYCKVIPVKVIKDYLEGLKDAKKDKIFQFMAKDYNPEELKTLLIKSLKKEWDFDYSWEAEDLIDCITETLTENGYYILKKDEKEELNYLCYFCKKRFETYQELKDHFIKNHWRLLR